MKDDLKVEAKSEQQSAIHERYEEVLEFFDWLKHDDREALELFLLKNMTATEVANELDISADAAYKRYERALQRLRDFMEEHGSLKKGKAS